MLDDPRPFYAPAFRDAVKSLALGLETTIRLDYPAEGTCPGPCLAVDLGPQPLSGLALLTAAIARQLHVYLCDELFDEWMRELEAMLAAVRLDGTVAYFPGWTL